MERGDPIGDWILDGPLGAGGMGTVYRAHHALTPRISAAIKVIRPGRFDDLRERFIREVEALERLQHPAIVRVKGWGEDAKRGIVWLAMDLVEGEELGARLRRGPLSADEATVVFRDLADGLAHAHEREIFHRDIKPANVILLPDGGARLVDFGIAAQGGRTRVSTAGEMPGTPAYLAPEVFGGVPEGRALDVYALGQVLFEAVTGRSAFPEPDALTTTQRLAHVAGQKMRTAHLDPGPGVPEPLRSLVQRATEPRPAQRLPSMAAFRAALDGEPLPARMSAPETLMLDLDLGVEPLPEPVAVVPAPVPPAPPAPPTPPPRRSAGVGWGVAAALAVVVSGAAWWAWPAGGRTLEVAVAGLGPGTPHVVVVDGRPATRLDAFRFVSEAVGDGEIAVAAGAACAPDAWDGRGCPSCCACASARAAPDASHATVVASAPPEARLTVTVHGVDAASPLVATLDGATGARSDGAGFQFQASPGTALLRVRAGDCAPEVAACGADCPPGCAIWEEAIEVPCAGEVARTVTLAVAPVPPVAPVAPVAASRPPAAAPSPSAAPAPEPAAVGFLHGLKVQVTHRKGRLFDAEAAGARLAAEGATVEIRSAYGGPMEKYYGFVYYYGADHEDEARGIQRLLRDLGYLEPREDEPDPDLDLGVWLDLH